MRLTREDSKKQRAEREVTEKERLMLATLEGLAQMLERQLDGNKRDYIGTDWSDSLVARRARALREAIELLGGEPVG